MNADLYGHWNYCVGSKQWFLPLIPQSRRFRRRGGKGSREIRNKQPKIKFPVKELGGNLCTQILAPRSMLPHFSHVFKYVYYISMSIGITQIQDSFTSVIINHCTTQMALHRLSWDRVNYRACDDEQKVPPNDTLSLSFHGLICVLVSQGRAPRWHVVLVVGAWHKVKPMSSKCLAVYRNPTTRELAGASRITHLH